MTGHRPDYPESYSALLWELMRGAGRHERNERTGRDMRVLHGACILVDLRDGLLPVPGNRRYYPGTAAAETAWFISGSRDVKDLNALGVRIWDRFAEDDGTVPAAYGHRWKNHFGRDQLSHAVLALREDPSSRQVVVTAWDPREDGLGRRGPKNVPCPAMFTLNAHAGELHSTVLVRSSDVFVGLPYDVMGHALLVSAIAEAVGGLRPGVMTLALANAHVYEDHWEMADLSLSYPMVRARVKLPRWRMIDIERDGMGFVREVLSRCEGDQHPYSPKVEAVL